MNICPAWDGKSAESKPADLSCFCFIRIFADENKYVGPYSAPPRCGAQVPQQSLNEVPENCPSYEEKRVLHHENKSANPNCKQAIGATNQALILLSRSSRSNSDIVLDQCLSQRHDSAVLHKSSRRRRMIKRNLVEGQWIKFYFFWIHLRPSRLMFPPFFLLKSHFVLRLQLLVEIQWQIQHTQQMIRLLYIRNLKPQT